MKMRRKSRVYQVIAVILSCIMIVGSVSVFAAEDNGANSSTDVSTVELSFTDKADIEHIEAVSTLVKSGVIDGFTDNTFRPKDPLTRAQACKILTRLYELKPASTGMFFNDTKGHWAEDYINCCASLEIICGYGDGRFAPDESLTVDAWSKMLLCAIGFDADEDGLSGEKWDETVSALSVESGLMHSESVGDSEADEVITRDNACDLAYNSVANGIFRKRIVPDMETVLAAYDEVFASSTKTYNIAKEYISNQSDEELEQAFLEAAENHDRIASEKKNIQSSLNEDDYAVFDRLNVPRADHDFLFESLPTNMDSLGGWAIDADSICLNSNKEYNEHDLLRINYSNELLKVYLTYGIMYYAANLSDENNAFLKDRLYSYKNIIPENVEWMSDAAEIDRIMNERMEDIIAKHEAEMQYLRDHIDERELNL